MAYEGLIFQASESWVKYKVTNVPYCVWIVNGFRVVMELLMEEVAIVTKMQLK